MGTKYTLRVYPDGMSRQVSRVIEIGGDETLDDLCSVILDSFDFDHDHLYEFLMNKKWGRGLRYVYQPRGFYPLMSYGEDDPTTDVTLDEVGLYRGRNIYLHYDFGDDWLFTIHVNKAEEVEGIPRTTLIKSNGELKQYPDWDEDEDEDWCAKEEEEED